MRNRHRRKIWDYLLPYLIIICVGVIIVLIVQLYSVLTSEHKSSEVYFHITRGEASLNPFGIDSWQKAYSGTRILQGDALKTAKNSQAVLQFYDGTLLRLGENAELSFDEIKNEDARNEFSLTLRRGDLWANKASGTEKITDLVVDMDNIRVNSIGTVFALSNVQAESVRVMQGRVKVDVIKFEDDEKKIVDSIEIGVGQEVTFDEKVLDAFRAYQRPYVLEAVSDEFKDSSWYLWNVDEDLNPTDFSKTTGTLGSGILKEEAAT